MTFFTSDGSKYIGMSQEIIIALRTQLGKETVFITEQEYLNLLNGL